MSNTTEALKAAPNIWRDLYRRAINEANGLTNYVEDRPELRSAERRLAKIEEEARAALAQAEPVRHCRCDGAGRLAPECDGAGCHAERLNEQAEQAEQAQPDDRMGMRATVQQAYMALEELQGPGFLIGGVMHHRIGLILPKLKDVAAALAAPPAAPQPVASVEVTIPWPPLPTPWKRIDDADGASVAVWRAFQMRDYALTVIAASTAAPQPQAAPLKPLTAEQVFASDDIMAVNAALAMRIDQLMDLVRAIERAHGIGAQEQEGGR